MSRQLLRVCRSIPAGSLKQGGTLSIESSFPGTRLKIQPEWREDGHLELEQWLPISEPEAEMVIHQDPDTLGRREAHLSVHLGPPTCTGKSGSERSPDTIATTRNSNTQRDPQIPGGKIITDDGVILPDSDEWHDVRFRRVDYNDGITHVIPVDDKRNDQQIQAPSLTLTATVPEKINLSCCLNSGGTISVTGKVEGDVHLHTSDGDIQVSKLRGHLVTLSAKQQHNTVFSSDLLEAESLRVSTEGRFRAKKVHGTDIHVQVGTAPAIDPVAPAVKEPACLQDDDDEGSLIDIGSLYTTRNGGADLSVSSATLSQHSAVRVKSHHGHVAVNTTSPFPASHTAHELPVPIVDLNGVNGSYDVLIQASGAGVSRLSRDESTRLAARIHVDSLSPDSISVVASEEGDISLSIDRKLEADLKMLSSNGADTTELRTALVHLEEQSDDLREVLLNLDSSSSGGQSIDNGILIATSAFTERIREDSCPNIVYVDGWVDNRSAEPDSRFDVKIIGGKIRMEGATAQALSAFVSSPTSDSDYARPLLMVATNGNIALESLSWFGAIARRFGLEKEQKVVGRTASRTCHDWTP